MSARRSTKGETIAIVGPSGGGKSTLLRCLNYLESFDAGEIEIAGVALAPGHGQRERELLRALRTKVGMVFQQFNLFPHLSALENITLAPRVVRRLERGAARARGRELLARVGLGDRARRVSARAVGRPAAARRDRARARAGARGAAVRRADQRARSGDARRGDGGDQGPRDGRHDDARRHARDAVRDTTSRRACG